MGLSTKVVTEAAVSWLSNPFNTMVVTELSESSWNGKRLDVLSVNPNAEKIIVIEVKTSRGDFHAGKGKFEMYMRFCHQFYVAAPRGLIKPSELPAGVGLLECGDTGKIRRKEYATTRPMEERRYTQILERVLQKLCVEGSRTSQAEAWKEQNKGYAFRRWLHEHERFQGSRPFLRR